MASFSPRVRGRIDSCLEAAAESSPFLLCRRPVYPLPPLKGEHLPGGPVSLPSPRVFTSRTHSLEASLQPPGPMGLAMLQGEQSPQMAQSLKPMLEGWSRKGPAPCLEVGLAREPLQAVTHPLTQPVLVPEPGCGPLKTHTTPSRQVHWCFPALTRGGPRRRKAGVSSCHMRSIATLLPQKTPT